MPKIPSRNPFYAVLVVVGILFVITTYAFFVMTIRDLDPSASTTAANHALLSVVEEHGFSAMMIELLVLALATVAAIGSDSYWTRRAETLDQTKRDAD